MARSRGNYGGSYKKDGDNSKYMDFLVDMMRLPHIDLYKSTAEDIQAHLVQYLEVTKKHDQRLSMANFALAFKISVPSLQNHLARKTKISEEVYNELLMIRTLINASLEDGMINGTANTVASIFLAKNNFGYKDQSEQLVVHEDRRLSKEELARLAENLPEVPEVVDADFSEIPNRQITDKGESEKNDGE